MQQYTAGVYTLQVGLLLGAETLFRSRHKVRNTSGVAFGIKAWNETAKNLYVGETIHGYFWIHRDSSWLSW